MIEGLLRYYHQSQDTTATQGVRAKSAAVVKELLKSKSTDFFEHAATLAKKIRNKASSTRLDKGEVTTDESKKAEDLSDVIALYSAIIQFGDPTIQYKAFFNRGVSHYMMGDKDKALADWEIVERNQPTLLNDKIRKVIKLTKEKVTVVPDLSALPVTAVAMEGKKRKRITFAEGIPGGEGESSMMSPEAATHLLTTMVAPSIEGTNPTTAETSVALPTHASVVIDGRTTSRKSPIGRPRGPGFR